jgi:DNA-binding SARP family transcriptional activator
MLYFRMLGRLEIHGSREVADPASPKLAGVLALLLCMPNQIVNTATIMDELWGENAPKTADATTHTYIYRLRKLFQRLERGHRDDDIPLETRAPGYILHVEDDQVDALQFEGYANQGRLLLAQGCTEEAVSALSDAISLWRGYALTNAACGQVVQAHVAHLHETFIRTRELHIQALFALGRHDETIDDLVLLARKHPLDEWIHGRLMQALSSCGRRSDAHMVYRRLSARLADELGIEPSPDLQELEAVTSSRRPPSLSLPPHGKGRTDAG